MGMTTRPEHPLDDEHRLGMAAESDCDAVAEIGDGETLSWDELTGVFARATEKTAIRELPFCDLPAVLRAGCVSVLNVAAALREKLMQRGRSIAVEDQETLERAITWLLLRSSSAETTSGPEIAARQMEACVAGVTAELISAAEDTFAIPLAPSSVKETIAQPEVEVELDDILY
jgi:hypothetical protein